MRKQCIKKIKIHGRSRLPYEITQNAYTLIQPLSRSVTALWSTAVKAKHLAGVQSLCHWEFGGMSVKDVTFYNIQRQCPLSRQAAVWAPDKPFSRTLIPQSNASVSVYFTPSIYPSISPLMTNCFKHWPVLPSSVCSKIRSNKQYKQVILANTFRLLAHSPPFQLSLHWIYTEQKKDFAAVAPSQSSI